MTAPLLSEHDEIAAVNVAAAVAKGADNMRKLAAYFHVAVDDADFRQALGAALAEQLVAFTAGCHFGGDHTPHCELEIVQ